VNAIVQREMIRATFELLDLNGDGELTKAEVLKGLKSSDKVGDIAIRSLWHCMLDMCH
jgi:Ca2+-binding EF-hand superfamily protein